MITARSRAVVSFCPPLEGESQHRHAGLGGKCGLWFGYLARSQRGGDRGGVVGQLGQFPLSQFGVRHDHRVALRRKVAAGLTEHGGGGVEATANRLEGPDPFGRCHDSRHDPLLEQSGTAEEHFSLVGEVSEERALRHSRAGGDLGCRCLIESLFGIQRESRLLQSAAAVRLPSTHGGNSRC